LSLSLYHSLCGLFGVLCCLCLCLFLCMSHVWRVTTEFTYLLTSPHSGPVQLSFDEWRALFLFVSSQWFSRGGKKQLPAGRKTWPFVAVTIKQLLLNLHSKSGQHAWSAKQEMYEQRGWIRDVDETVACDELQQRIIDETVIHTSASVFPGKQLAISFNTLIHDLLFLPISTIESAAS